VNFKEGNHPVVRLISQQHMTYQEKHSSEGHVKFISLRFLTAARFKMSGYVTSVETKTARLGYLASLDTVSVITWSLSNGALLFDRPKCCFNIRLLTDGEHSNVCSKLCVDG